MPARWPIFIRSLFLLRERKQRMTNWIDEAIKEEQRQDLLRQAARRRLIAQARATNRRPKRIFSPVLVRLGRWLEACGRCLQVRDGALAEAGVVRTVGDSAGQC